MKGKLVFMKKRNPLYVSVGRPTGFTVSVATIRLCNGAGFIVAETGDIMTLPGLPAVPAACGIDIDNDGNISGLF